MVIFLGSVVTAFSGRLPCIFLSVPDYVVQDGWSYLWKGNPKDAYAPSRQTVLQTDGDKTAFPFAWRFRWTFYPSQVKSQWWILRFHFLKYIPNSCFSFAIISFSLWITLFANYELNIFLLSHFLISHSFLLNFACLMVLFWAIPQEKSLREQQKMMQK